MIEDTGRWLAIPTFEGLYEASDLGFIRSLDRKILTARGWYQTYPGRILAQIPAGRPGKPARLWVALSRENVTRHYSVHRLVLITFTGACPPGMMGCHNDGNFRNNAHSNLEWKTASDNMLDSVAHGTHHEARKSHCNLSHLLAWPNLVRSKLEKGRRACRACTNAAYRCNALRREGLPVPDFQREADKRYRRLMASPAADELRTKGLI